MKFKERIKKLNERTFDTGEVINILLYLILCVMPLILGSSGSDRYYYPKALFLYCVGTVIFILMIKEKVKLNRRIDKVYLLFFFWLLLSVVNALDVKRAILGGTWRYEGIITLFMYGVIFIAASRYFVLSKKGINLFLTSGLIVAIYYIIQNFGFEPLNFWLDGAEKMNATIGNRNFLSSYMLIFLGVSICGFIFWQSKKCFIYSLCYFGALIFSQTRGGWLGLGFFCLIGLVLIRKDKERIKRAGVILMAFILIFTGINIKSGGLMLDRFESIAEDVEDLDVTSGSGRIGIYIGTMHVALERPLLGTGVECLWDGFKEDAPKKIVEAWQAQKTMVDKAHNEILHYAGTSGIPAAILYIILVFLVMKNLWKEIKDDRVKVFFIVLIGYLFQANLNISVVPVAPLFWIILGIGSNPEIIKRLKIEEA